MSDLNSVNLIGRLTRDVEVRYMSNGKPVAGFTIAVSKQWKDESGQRKEKACFVDVSLFGSIVEAIKQYMTKGVQVRVTGELKQDSWEKDGIKHSKLAVLATEIQLLQRPSNNGGQAQQAGNGYGGAQYGNAYSQPQQEFAQNQGGFVPSNDGFSEDIPF